MVPDIAPLMLGLSRHLIAGGSLVCVRQNRMVFCWQCGIRVLLGPLIGKRAGLSIDGLQNTRPL